MEKIQIHFRYDNNNDKVCFLYLDNDNYTDDSTEEKEVCNVTGKGYISENGTLSDEEIKNLPHSFKVSMEDTNCNQTDEHLPPQFHFKVNDGNDSIADFDMAVACVCDENPSCDIFKGIGKFNGFDAEFTFNPDYII